MSGITVTINSGSSSVKFAAFRTEDASAFGRLPERMLHGEIEYGNGDGDAHLTARDHDDVPLAGDTSALEGGAAATSANSTADGSTAFSLLFRWMQQHVQGRLITAVAHRVVHGGERFVEPVRITPAVLDQLQALCPLAPLHQPHNLAAIRAILRLAPDLMQVACFDTAFHASQSTVMRSYALPERITQAGVRRYGFHGISYEYIASVLPEHVGALADGRIVVAHLGNGASMCAIAKRRSVASTMGFTALDGLMMGTRCGQLDPGVLLYLMSEMKMSESEIEALLYRESGLLGVSGLSGDMRTLETSRDPRAAAAIDLYVSYILRELGGLAAMLGGLDALVFTGGIGQHSEMIRERVCQGAQWLGIELDASANAAQAGCITAPSSRVSVFVIPTNEELMLALHAQAMITEATRT